MNWLTKLLKAKTLAGKGDWLRAVKVWNNGKMPRHGACPPFQRTHSWPVDKRPHRQKGALSESHFSVGFTLAGAQSQSPFVDYLFTLNKLLLVLLCLLGACPVHADWPLVRGDAQASGVASTPLSADLDVLWKVTLDESGFEATAIVVDGTIYVGDFDGTFHAFSLNDGKPLWKKTFAESGFTEAAAFAEGRIFVTDFNGIVRCLDMKNGEVLWSHEAASESYAAPNVHDGKVLLTLEAGELLALDTKTGDLQWRYRIEAPLRCWPTVVEGRILLAGCDQRFHAVDISTGKEVAGLDIDAQTGATPAAMNGDVFFGTEQGTFYSITAKTMQVHWEASNPKHGQPIRASAAVDRRCIIFPNHGKLVTALNPTDGSPLWTFTVRSRVESSPVIAGDLVFLPTKRGRLYAVDVVSGKEKWQYQAGGTFLASPAIAKGKLIIGNEDGTLYCFGEQAKSEEPLINAEER